METLVYSLEPGESGHAPRIAVSVPKKTYGKLEYDDNAKFFKKIRASKNGVISYEGVGEGATFVIDPFAMGRSGDDLGEKASETAATLLFLIDQAASARDELSPLIRLRPVPTAMDKVFRSNVFLAGQAQPEQLDHYAAAAHTTMAGMYSDIICRGDGNGRAQGMVTAQIYPVEGVYLGVWKPREWMRSQPLTEDLTELSLVGRTSRLEHSIIHPGGALAIFEAMQLATE
jgi:hypothetical protein